MAQTIFLSHAGADAAQAAAVANILTAAGIDVRFDRKELCFGASFLSFMESALADSDYCLLLWSRNAATTPWVQLEWESGLYRSVQEKRAFLVAARLEETSLPALLAPRLRVDLFPELQPGIGKIVDTWSSDRSAEAITQRPVASSAIMESPASGHDTVYVTSEAFGITVPLQPDLSAPAGVLLDTIVDRAGLPKIWQFEGRLGVRFAYTLMNGEQPLDRAVSLSAQNVVGKSILWLKTRMSQFSEAAPMEGTLTNAVFRDYSPPSTASSDPLIVAQQKYLSAIRSARLAM